MNDTTDFFAVRPEQRTLYQENVCRPGWVGSMPEEHLPPLYVPNEICFCTPDEPCEACWQERCAFFDEMDQRAAAPSETPW
jgi:hypothetical protein